MNLPKGSNLPKRNTAIRHECDVQLPYGFALGIPLDAAAATDKTEIVPFMSAKEVRHVDRHRNARINGLLGPDSSRGRALSRRRHSSAENGRCRSRDGAS